MSQAKSLINTLLVDVFNHILSIEEDMLKKAGVELSMTEVHVLEAVRNAKEPTMSVVSRKLRVTMGTLTTSVNTLVNKGFIERERGQKDRRKVFLKLTDEALKVLKIHDKFHDEMIDSVFKDLKLEEDEVLIRSLQNIKDYFQKKF